MNRTLHHLDLNLLKALDALLDEQSVTKAAAKMAVTQSAMSNMLARLRENFDDPLFIRSQYGITPTLRAAALAKPLKAWLAEIETLIQPPQFEPQSAELKLSIGATDYGFYSVVVPFLTALKQQAPLIKVALLPIQAGNTAARLQSGELDFALISEAENSPDFHSQALYQERYVCAMRADHPACAEPMDLEHFCRLEHALVSYQGNAFSGTTDLALEKLGRKRRVGLSVNSFLLLPEILQRSDFIAVLPERLVLHNEQLYICEPPLEIQGFTKVLAWSDRTHYHPAYRWLRELLVACCGEKV